MSVWLRRLAMGSMLPIAIGVQACRVERAISFGDTSEVGTTTHGGSAPSLALSSAGHRAVSWVAPKTGTTPATMYVSVDGAAPVAIADSLGTVQVHAEAPPQLAFDRRGMLYLVYVVTRDVGKRFPESALRVTHSLDNGKSWTPPLTVTDDSVVFGAHNFHSIAVSSDGRLYVSWLDGREGAMATYFTWTDDAGTTWSKNTKLAIGETCPCCHTSIAAGKNGLVYTTWRAVFPGNVRDIVLARSTNGGRSWEKPMRIHEDGWVYPGCPHAGPSVRVDTAGRVHVLWWTGAEKRGGVWLASSVDDGKTFSEPLSIAAQKHPTPTHVQLGADIDDDLVVVWDDAHGASSTINIRVSKDAGHSFGRPFALSDSADNAIHPSLTVNDNAAIIAWTQSAPIPTAPPSQAAGHAMGHDHETMGGGSHGAGAPAGRILMREVRF